MRQIVKRTSAIVMIFALSGWGRPSWSQEGRSKPVQSATQQTRSTDAEAGWSGAAKAHSRDPMHLANLGLVEARQGHYTQAIVFYREAMALQPTMPGLRLNMGLAYFKNSQFKEAIRTFTPLLKASSASAPEVQRLTFLIGMSHYGLGEFKAAAADLKQSADSDPQNLPLLLTLAHSCLLSEQYPCVVDTYHRMVLINPRSAEADMLVGEALDEMNDLTGATKEFRAAVESNDREPNVHFGLGYLLWKQFQYPEAAKEFRAELVNTPNYTQAALYLADCYLRMYRMSEARLLLERLVKDDPNIYMERLDLGIVYAAMGHNQDGLREFKAAIRLRPDDVNAHLRLGHLYRSMGKPTASQEQFNIAKALNRSADEGLSHVLNSAPYASRASTAGAEVQ